MGATRANSRREAPLVAPSPRRRAAGVLRPRCESARKVYRHNLRGGLERFQATRPDRNIPRFSYHARLPAMGTKSHLGTHLCFLPIHDGESTGSVPEPSSMLLLGSGVLGFAAVMRRRLKM